MKQRTPGERRYSAPARMWTTAAVVLTLWPGCSGRSASTDSASRETRDGPGREAGRGGASGGPGGPTVPVTAAVGTLPGALAVSSAGQAQLSIPLAFAPGVRGLVPELSLNYSSGGGNGLLGVGWSLGGLSSVRRCKSSLRRDGVRNPIRFQHDRDLYCLDGQRLVPIAGAVSGTDGAEYRTENNGNLRVIGHQLADHNGSSFTVYYPDGRIGTYGATDDATVKTYGEPDANGSIAATPVEWKVKRLEDRHGNGIDYTYAFEKRRGPQLLTWYDTEHRVTSIRYAGGAAVVELEYERRPDLIAGFAHGTYNQLSYRLTEVVASGSGDPFRRYRLHYAAAAVESFPAADTGRSRIERLEECIGDGTVCKPATELTWSPVSTGDGALARDEAHFFEGLAFPEGSAAENVPQPAVKRQLVGDFDDDGRTDLMVAQGYGIESGGTWKLWSGRDAWQGLDRIDTGVPVRLFPSYETHPGESHKVYVSARLPASQAINYDGRNGGDVASVLPSRRLADLLEFSGEYTFMVWNGEEVVPGKPRHPGVGEGFQILRRNDDDSYQETLIADPSHRPMLYSYWLNINGDMLSDVVFCRSDTDVEARYSGGLSGEIPFWTKGSLHYAINRPGLGIDLATATDTRHGCFFHDMVQVLDTDGDGDDEFMFIGGATSGMNGTPNHEGAWDSNYQAMHFDTNAGVTTIVDSGLPVDFLHRLRGGWHGLPRYGGMSADLKGDFNGDGLVDVLRYQLGVGDRLANVEAIKTVESFGQAFVYPEPNEALLLDKDEDGGIHLWLNTGTSFVDAHDAAVIEIGRAAGFWRHLSSAFTMDYNGDGITDLMMRDPRAHLMEGKGENADAGPPLPDDAYAKIHVFLGNAELPLGSPFAGEPTPILHQYDRWNHWATNACDGEGGDDDSDEPPSESGSWHGAGSGGDADFYGDEEYDEEEDEEDEDDGGGDDDDGGGDDDECNEPTIHNYQAFTPKRHYLAMELNGDGLTDVMTFDPQAWVAPYDSHARLQVWTHAGAYRNDLVTAVENGLGAKDRVAYQPMSTPGGVYLHRELPPTLQQPAYPVTTIMGDTPLVVSLSRDNGNPGVPQEIRWDYTYRNARADLIEGSFLGMELTTVRHARLGPDYEGWFHVEQTWYDTTTYDAQARRYPFAGTVRARVEATIGLGYLHDGVDNTDADVATVRKVSRSFAKGPTDLAGTFRSDLVGQRTEDYEITRSSAAGVEERLFCLLVSPLCANDSSFPLWLWANPDRVKTEAFSNHDLHGNIRSYAATLADGSSLHVQSTFLNDTTNWLIGRLTGKRTTNQTSVGASTRTETKAYTATGDVHYAVTEPYNAALKQGVIYSYDDPFGNVTRTTLVTALDWGTRFEESEWTPDGRFPEVTKNALGHRTSFEWNTDFGLVTRVVEPGYNYHTFQYDGFGRTVAARTFSSNDEALGQPASYAYAREEQEPGRFVTVTSSTVDGRHRVTKADRLGRTIRAEGTGPGGQLVYVDSQYDILGRAAGTSLPALIGDAPVGWTMTAYDTLHRPSVIRAPDGSENRFTYALDRITHTDAQGRVDWKQLDKLGRPMRWQDGLESGVATPSEIMCADYGVFDTLLALRPCTPTPAKAPVSMQYDLLGRRIVLDDAAVGLSYTGYNGFGEVSSFTNAANQTLIFTYDALGRRRTREHGGDVIASWLYDVDVPGTLSTSTSADGNTIGYEYDEYTKHLVAVETTVDGATYRVGYDFDAAHDRLAAIHYPVVADAAPFAVRYGYDDAGYLEHVAGVGLGAPVYWQRDVSDASGQTIRETFGNGVVTTRGIDPSSRRLNHIQSDLGDNNFERLDYKWHPGGTLKERKDSGSHLFFPQLETVTYDGLDRIVNVHATDLVQSRDVAVSYDGLGNILSRTGLATYTYDGEQLVGVAGSDYQATYGYDAVGNRDTQVVDGVPTAFTYNLGNKVTEIVSGEPASLRLLFTYDADLNLVTRRETVGNVESVYVSGLFERRSSPEPGKNYEHVFTIVGPEVAVAEVTRTFPEEEVSAFTTATRYLHRDHLGSISSTTDEDGEVVHRLSFDAWGQRRPAVISDDNQSLPASAVHEGFTGHDNALEVLGLIDMKGRLYDARNGRFAQADPFVQAPYYSQSLNRYAYVFNNPLSLVDPSGYSSEDESVCGEDCYGEFETEPIYMTIEPQSFGGFADFNDYQTYEMDRADALAANENAAFLNERFGVSVEDMPSYRMAVERRAARQADLANLSGLANSERGMATGLRMGLGFCSHPACRVAGYVLDGLLTEDALAHASSERERLEILADAYSPADLPGSGRPHGGRQESAVSAPRAPTGSTALAMAAVRATSNDCLVQARGLKDRIGGELIYIEPRRAARSGWTKPEVVSAEDTANGGWVFHAAVRLDGKVYDPKMNTVTDSVNAWVGTFSNADRKQLQFGIDGTFLKDWGDL